MPEEPVEVAPRRRSGQVDGVRASVVVVCFLVALLLLLGPASRLTAAARSDTTTTTIHHAPPPPVQKNKVTVAVANAAGKEGAAKTESSTLTTKGWNVLSPTTALGPTRDFTTVHYAVGFEQAALDLAHEIGVSPKRVAATTPAVSNVVVSPATTADVLVLLGKDLAT